MKNIKFIFSCIFIVGLLFITSCSNPSGSSGGGLSNENSGSGSGGGSSGGNNPGQGDSKDRNNPTIIEVDVSELREAINSYKPGTYTIYKVSGEMSNDDYDSLLEFIYDKRRNWDEPYIGLDLSDVTGLTRISTAWCLFNLVIPKTLSEIAEGVSMFKITIPSENPNFKYVDGILYSADDTILYYYTQKEEETFVIPSTVKKIWTEAFIENKHLKSITIPESVFYIGNFAFSNTKIENIIYEDKSNWYAFFSSDRRTIPFSSGDLENVSNYIRNGEANSYGVFSYALRKLETKIVNLEQLKEDIEINSTPVIYKFTGEMTDDEFGTIRSLLYDKYVALDLSAVTGLKRFGGFPYILFIVIPTADITISDDCYFKNVLVSPDDPKFTNDNGIIYSKDKTVLYCYPIEKTAETFEIPSTVKRIWYSAFRNNWYVKNIIIPEGVIEIGGSNFYNTELNSLTFRNTENWLRRDYDYDICSVLPEELGNLENYKSNGMFHNYGLFKEETKTVTVEELRGYLDLDNFGIFTTFKVTGSLTDEEYVNILKDVNQKDKRLISLDLSEVTGITKISDVGNLYTLTIPVSLSNLNLSRGFDKILIPDRNNYFKYEDDVLYSGDKSILYYYSKKKNDASFIIPSTVKKIHTLAFYYSNTICNITIPESTYQIGVNAFDNQNIEKLSFVDKNNWIIIGSTYRNGIKADMLETAENYWENNNSPFSHGKFYNCELNKYTTKEINKWDDLRDAILQYESDRYTVLEYTDLISSDDCETICGWIRDKCKNDWENRNYLGLDLSGIKSIIDVSRIDVGCLFRLVIPGNYSDTNFDFNDVIIPPNNFNFKQVDGVVYSADQKILYYCAEEMEGFFEIPSTVKKIWPSAFEYTSISHIIVPESVNYIASDSLNTRCGRNAQIEFKDEDNWMRFKLIGGNSYPVIPSDIYPSEMSIGGAMYKAKKMNITAEQLQAAIEAYSEEETYIIYKVTGSMSNDDYSTILSLIKRKVKNDWKDIHMGLDLSEVTGLTSVTDFSPLIYIKFSDDSIYTGFGII